MHYGSYYDVWPVIVTEPQSEGAFHENKNAMQTCLSGNIVVLASTKERGISGKALWVLREKSAKQVKAHFTIFSCEPHFDFSDRINIFKLHLLVKQRK